MAAASDPLFLLDRATLKESLRLGKLIETDAAAPLLNDAIQKTRVKLLRNLPERIVLELLATPSVASPTTASEVRRVEAEQLEIIMVRKFLIEDLPTAFMDAGGGMLDWYQKEAPFRMTNAYDRGLWIKSLADQANELAEELCKKQFEAQECSSLGDRVMGVADLRASTEDAPALGSLLGRGIRL